MSEIVLNYTRAGHVENIHRGDMAAVNCKGEVVAAIGNANLPMFWRSAAKPFQALPFVKNGGLERYKITDEELALLVSSHSGEENHVALVRGILSKLGLDESVLDCGVVRPMSGKAFKKIIAAGEKVLPVHNPCSGKHSQIIALSMMLGISYEGYIRPEHEAQKIIFKHVAMAARIPEEKLATILDGNGKSKTGNNIAIYNTHHRLQILYGEKYGLSYSSKVGCGTDVYIQLPAKKAADTIDK